LISLQYRANHSGFCGNSSSLLDPVFNAVT